MGKIKGYNEAYLIENLIKHNRIEVKKDHDLTIPQITNFGKSEQTTIIEAYKEKKILIIDDRKQEKKRFK